jgi:hypothetical protein
VLLEAAPDTPGLHPIGSKNRRGPAAADVDFAASGRFPPVKAVALPVRCAARGFAAMMAG